MGSVQKREDVLRDVLDTVYGGFEGCLRIRPYASLQKMESQCHPVDNELALATPTTYNVAEVMWRVFQG